MTEVSACLGVYFTGGSRWQRIQRGAVGVDFDRSQPAAFVTGERGRLDAHVSDRLGMIARLCLHSQERLATAPVEQRLVGTDAAPDQIAQAGEKLFESIHGDNDRPGDEAGAEVATVELILPVRIVEGDQRLVQRLGRHSPSTLSSTARLSRPGVG